MICKNCGRQIENKFTVCKYCGVVTTQGSAVDVNAKYNVPSADVSYRPQPTEKQKKTPWKIIVPVVAILLVVVFALGMVFGVKGKQKKYEKLLREMFEDYTDKPVVEFICDDFDDDGVYEAYAVAGESENKGDFTEYYDADICFVNETTAGVVKESVRGHSNGVIETDDRTFVSFEVYDEQADEGVSYVYSAIKNRPVESEISGQYSELHQEDGKILATDETGDDVEVHITNVFKKLDIAGFDDSADISDEDVTETETFYDETTDENSATTTQPTTAIAVTTDAKELYKAALSNGGIANYSSGAGTWAGQDVYTCLVDLNGDGVDELLMEMGADMYSKRYCLFAVQNGKVVKLIEKNDGSGRGYGDMLYLSKITATGKPVLVARLGLGGSSMYTSGELTNEVYTYNGVSLSMLKKTTVVYAPISDSGNSGSFPGTYKIDGISVSENEYYNESDKYGIARNGPGMSHNGMIRGSYSNPLPY